MDWESAFHELEAETALLRARLALVSEEDAAVMAVLAERASKGDVQAAKLWIEERRRREAEGRSQGQLSLADLVLPAGTRIDSTVPR